MGTWKTWMKWTALIGAMFLGGFVAVFTVVQNSNQNGRLTALETFTNTDYVETFTKRVEGVLGQWQNSPYMRSINTRITKLEGTVSAAPPTSAVQSTSPTSTATATPQLPVGAVVPTTTIPPPTSVTPTPQSGQTSAQPRLTQPSVAATTPAAPQPSAVAVPSVVPQPSQPTAVAVAPQTPPQSMPQCCNQSEVLERLGQISTQLQQLPNQEWIRAENNRMMQDTRELLNERKDDSFPNAPPPLLNPPRPTKSPEAMEQKESAPQETDSVPARNIVSRKPAHESKLRYIPTQDPLKCRRFPNGNTYLSRQFLVVDGNGTLQRIHFQPVQQAAAW